MFDFYAYNGNGTVNTYINSRQGSAMYFLKAIMHSNQFRHIILTLD